MSVCRVGAFLVLGALACSSMSGPQRVTLSASVNRTEIKSGEPVIMTVSLTNPNPDAVTLTVSGCPIRPYVATLAGAVVMPSGGSWVCTAQISRLTLGPGETQQQAFEWARASGLATELPEVPSLPPGVYNFYATLVAQEETLSTQRFEIRLD
ncbi:MAG TPA: hypothetical protein VNX15_07980 [Gemmatimonadales bacterium]|jgi:hypothetical protein|nr:hypothetical protein [Gemmatimonadales bacterium]